MLIFKRELYENDEVMEYIPDLDEKWLSYCDGKTLTKKFTSGDGMIDDYFIAKEWLVEEK